MIEVLLCREMKWDHEQYESQPSWFKDVLFILLQEEAAHMNNKAKSS